MIYGLGVESASFHDWLELEDIFIYPQKKKRQKKKVGTHHAIFHCSCQKKTAIQRTQGPNCCRHEYLD
ncbi:hypothetical protein V6N13_129532 [Hibiscus sabdariffa]|uniref:Uncharacterized protein n=1 Tax=Hibiscus sabdariffa TaxID=183260 RepID=A0ABR2SLF1_9ROSI